MKTLLPSILAAAFLVTSSSLLSYCDAVTAPRPKVTTVAAAKALRGGAVDDHAASLLRHAVVNEKKLVPKAAAAKKSPPKAAAGSSSGHTEAILGSLAMIGLEQGVKKIFAKQGIKFPTSLGGCIVLFFGLLFLDLVVPGSGKTLYEALGPATALLTKWLPVFFVPGLAMLPLAPSVGSGLEVSKQALVDA